MPYFSSPFYLVNFAIYEFLRISYWAIFQGIISASRRKLWSYHISIRLTNLITAFQQRKWGNCEQNIFVQVNLQIVNRYKTCLQ